MTIRGAGVYGGMAPEPGATPLTDEQCDRLMAQLREPARTPISSAVPRLLAAVEAVLALHAGQIDGDFPQAAALCVECGQWSPCPTVRAISAALPGEEKADVR